MKVELEKLRLGKSALTDNVYVGIVENDKISFKHHHDVTSDFYKAIVDWCMGQTRIIKGGGKQFKITCEEIKS